MGFIRMLPFHIQEVDLMKLLIHDLSEKEWNRVSSDYEGWTVISDNGTIRPCVGCFGCWLKNPGECIIKDGYERMGALFHMADEVKVISRYTYGGFSSFVKNVFDRSIGWVLPFFEVYEGEMHHKKRYPEDKPMRFVFRGRGLTDADKEKAKRYVEAVARNFRAVITDISFEESEALQEEVFDHESIRPDPQNRVVLLNCSLRGKDSNTEKFLMRLRCLIDGEVKCIRLSSFIDKEEELIKNLSSTGELVLGMPLYVDGIPSPVLRIMERMEQEKYSAKKEVYVVVNNGLYESVQNRNLLSMARLWCERSGYGYGGGVAIGAGEMIGMTLKPSGSNGGPAKLAEEGIKKLAEAINSSKEIEDIYADAYRFPRFLYMLAANMGWPKAGKNNGLKRKDLLRQRL